MKSVYFAIAAAGITLASAATVMASETAEWAPLPAGSTMTFVQPDGQEETQTVTAIEGVALKRERDGTVLTDFGLQVVLSPARNEKMDSDYQAAAASLWPLEVGKKVNYYHRGMTDGRGWQVADTAEVTGIEEITVPAGTYKTFVIKTSMSNAPWFEGKRTCWYAPDVGYCAKIHFKSSSRRNGEQEFNAELKSFTKP